ncbi:MAG: protein kinase [Myxococcota bacterium]|nr:protein kinase [Myxococcota bacterium]
MSSYPNREEVPKRLGRYELIGQLATGGMAEIHLARLAGEGGFEKIVVVKRLLPELVASPAYVSMFLDEGRLVSRLDHPNICEVHELGRDGGEYYLAMPYLDGIAVHELIARPRDPDRTAQLQITAGVVVQACAGLHHAHELKDADGGPAGLVHRDVSPSNLFVTSSGVVKVLDFGIAKVRGATETEVGTIKGKQQYMAPEQLLGEALDRRCDVFALGIVLFELATHSRLFKRASDYLTARAVLEEPVPRADAVDPAVPKALADVIEKALARDRDKRYATAAELATAIEAAIQVGKSADIAAAVTSTDELSKMRTRQARVIDQARVELPTVTSVDVLAPTVAYRSPAAAATPPTLVDARPVRRRDPIAIAVIFVAMAAVAILLVVTRDSSTTKAVIDAPVAMTTPTDAAPADAAPAEAPATIEIDAGDIEMPPVDISRPPAKQPGMLSIDSTPWATIYIDGSSLGITPIVKRSLPAGRHKLRAVLKDGRVKEQTIDIPAGRLAKPIQLTW